MPQATLSPSARFRKRFGTKGADGAYHLPLPPKGHPLARTFAAAVLRRAHQVTALPAQTVAKIVGRANAILYGKPDPSAADKARARTSRRERDLSYFTESLREAYMDVPPMSGSHEDELPKVLAAVQQDERFGGPCCEYDADPTPGKTALRPYHLSIISSYPREKRVVVNNSRDGKLFEAKYKLGEDGGAEITGCAECEMQVAKKAQEVLREMREAGRSDPQHVPVRIVSPIKEASRNDDGSYQVIALTVGPGNPLDKNWYLETFIDDAIALAEGNRSFFDHPSVSEERDLPERSVLKLAGWFSDARKVAWRDPADPAAEPVPAAAMTFHPRVNEPTVDSLIRTCQEHAVAFPAKRPFVAFSINGFGAGNAGDAPDGSGSRNLMERMTRMDSIDLVTQAGARGRFVFEEPSVKTARGKTRSREAGFVRFADGELAVDLRTDAEREADNAKARRKLFAVVAESALTGAAGKTIREALAIAPKAKFSELKETEQDDVLAKLGLTDTSAVGVTLGELLDGAPPSVREARKKKDGDSADGEEDDPEDDDAEDGEDDGDGDEPNAKDKKKKRESNRITALERQVEERDRQLEAIGRNRVLTAALARHKVHEAHRPLIEPLVATVERPEEIDRIVTAYAAANRTDDSAGAVGQTREGAAAGGGGYKPSFRKE